MKTLRLGTRDSALALWQANWVKNELERLRPGVDVTVVSTKTTGDKFLDAPLAKIGGKGLFTKEIDEAILDHRTDLAVHSLKDVPFQLPNGLELAAVPLREDARDAFISAGRRIGLLPAGARIGTSSLRRQTQIRHHFPTLDLIPLRGNVDTRLRRLAAGDFEGIILAAAGLKRLGYESRVTEVLGDDIMIPAVGQGALGILCRSGDESLLQLLSVLDHEETRLSVTAERALLRCLEGNCQVPIAGHARFESDGRLCVKAVIASIDGEQLLSDELTGPAVEAYSLGLRLGNRLLAKGADQILAQITRRGTEQ